MLNSDTISSLANGRQYLAIFTLQNSLYLNQEFDRMPEGLIKTAKTLVSIVVFPRQIPIFAQLGSDFFL
jgi:hypothetical protein